MVSESPTYLGNVTIPNDASNVLNADGITAARHAVRVVIAAADAFSRADNWAIAEVTYDRAIELASSIDDHDGVGVAAANAVDMGLRRGGPGLDHARQVAEWLLAIGDPATHRAGEQQLTAVAERAATDGDAVVLRKCLEAAYRATSVAKVEGPQLSTRWPETVEMLEGKVRSNRPVESPAN